MRPAGFQRSTRPQDERVRPCHRRGSGRGGGGCVDVPRCRTGQGCAQRDRVPGHRGRHPHTRGNECRVHGPRHASSPAVDHRSGEGRMIPTIERIKPTPTIGVDLTRKELIVLDRLVFRGLVDTMLEINTYTEERHDDFRTEANDERRTLQSLQAKIERTLRQ